MKNKDIIRETLINDLAIHKGLKVNTLLNLELKQDLMMVTLLIY